MLSAGASFREPDEPATRGCEAVSSGSFCIAEPVPVGRESPDAGTCSPDLSDLDDVSDEKQLGEQDACPAGMMAASRKQKDVIVANPALELCRAAEWSSVPPKLKETEPLLESTPCIGAEADAGIHHQPGNSVQDTAVPSLPTLSVADTCAVAQAIQDFLDHIGMGQQVHVAQLHGSAQHERIAREFQRHADNLHWEVELQSGHTMTLGWKTCKSPR